MPVVLLHGTGQSRTSWAASAQALAQAGFHTIALDLRGHGDSDWAADGGYEFGAYADDLRVIMQDIGQPSALVGASLGGLTTLLAVGEEPALPATCVVLVDILPWLEPAAGDHVSSFMLGTVSGFDTLDQAAEIVADFLPHRPRPKRADGLLRHLRQKGDGRWYWRWDPNTIRPQPGWDLAAMNTRFAAATAAVRVPIMLIHGSASEIVSTEGVARFAAMRPDVRITAIAGAHHMVAGDDNDAFLDAIVPFLREVRGF